MAVTIHEVAKGADVSVSTVSRAFTMPDMVNAATRRKVLQVAEELGYQPNRAARGLVTGKTGNIGVVVPDVANPFFSAMLKGCTARAREVRHVVFLADAAEDPRVEAEVVGAMAKQVDGVVLCSPRMHPSQLERLVGSTPLVLINSDEAGLPAVLMDSADGARQAVEHLAALGHRRVAHLAGPPASWAGEERLRGVRAAAPQCDVEIVELGPFPPTFQGGVQAADLALARGVTAILAFNDLMAVGVLNRLAARGVAVPEDISVVGYDDIEMSSMTTVPLTTVRMPMEAAGRAAVDLLLDGLDAGDEPDVTRRWLPTQLIVRSTTAPPGRDAGSPRVLAGR
ncbi:LacI family DNA-binding transcriptional regulator [Pseudonocardia cypriaca]|uniref:LacI family transcriptional regulator n=1 Tax=Pseudonocardia cypriaca TaxID=882449 RepID=A0A543GJ45_9PSEU|nr:LacI family DNA-binding transcriptional regulator [Pseudonocardia cypriaca]TQM46065.1 LacI family transcriptional regulator [Pseudonocardia cypriaca]